VTHFVLVVVTGEPEIVVVVFVHPSTDEQKLVKESVRVLVLTIAFEQEDIAELVQNNSTAYIGLMKAVAVKTKPKMYLILMKPGNLPDR